MELKRKYREENGNEKNDTSGRGNGNGDDSSTGNSNSKIVRNGLKPPTNEHYTFGAKCRHLGDGITTQEPGATTITCGPRHHFVETLGCVKDHLTHREAFDLGCKLGTND
jgi:hypothetical protein